MAEASSDGSQPKTAFVFAGGGSFGAVQVGMLRSLVAHGITADMAVGSSVGAMNSAYYAGTPTSEGVERLARIWRDLRRRDVFPITPRVLLGLMRRRDFLLGSGGLYRLVHAHPTPSDLPPDPARVSRPGYADMAPSDSGSVNRLRPWSFGLQISD